MAGEITGQRLAPGGAGQIGRDDRPPQLEARRQGFLHQAHALEHREAATAPRLAALKIPDGRLQITGDALPHAAIRAP